ncbi:MAG: hypothetical protein PVF34_13105 [Gammaproteobacteria bacterium]|jgi:hypothetical protein
MRKFWNRCYSLVLCGLIAAGLSPVTHGADLLTLADTGDKGFRASEDPVIIRFGQELPSDLVPYLRLEIDAIDVSDFVQRSNEEMVYTPQTPLEHGEHELRVVAVLPDGVIEEAALWKIEVRASETFRVAQVNGQVDLQVMQRIADDIEKPAPDKTQGQGAATLASRHADGNWTANSQFNMIFNSQEEQTLTGEEFDLTDYQVVTNWTQSALTLGHQNLSPNSLILNEFNRRGLSFNYRGEQQRFQAIGFSARTEQITGFRNFTGINDADHRTNGITLSAYPIPDNPQWLGVTAIYLDSRGVSEGQAQINDTTEESGGDARSILIDSYLGDRLWHLHGEVAKTSFDFDGVDAGFGAQDDDATTLSIGYDTSRRQSNEGQPDYTWGVSMVRQRVGPWFYSLGNTAVTVDRETTQLLANYQDGKFGANAVMSAGEDNVDDINTLPTTEIDTALVNLTYVPAAGGGDDASSMFKGMFKNPNFSLSWTQNKLDQVTTPTGFTGDDVNSSHDELIVMAAFSGDTWYWSLSHSMIQQDDKVNTANSADTNTTSLESQVAVNEKFNLAPIVQVSETDYGAIDTVSRSWLAGITFNFNYPADWNYSFSYTVNREEASDDSIDNRMRLGQLTLQWQYLQPSPNKFGMSFFNTASHTTNEVGPEELDQYQVFLGVNVTLPVSL